MQGNSLSLLGVADKKISQFEKKKIESIEDLLWFTPTYYTDCSKVVQIKDLGVVEGQCVTVKGRIERIKLGPKTFSAVVKDDTGVMTVTWFGQHYLMSKLHRGDRFFFCGTPSKVPPYLVTDDEEYSIISPVAFGLDVGCQSAIIPHYRKIVGMSNDYLVSKIEMALDFMHSNNTMPDYMDETLRKALNVCSTEEFLEKAHRPQNKQDMAAVEMRRVIDILFPFAFKLKIRDTDYAKRSPFVISKTGLQEKFIRELPYRLTDDQSTTVKELTEKMRNGERVDALIQGDVGCGKTVVALALAVAAAENGYQVALMCPTTVLAGQHYENINSQMAPYGLKVAFFRSGMAAKEKKALLAEVASGEVNIVIGTHAIISESVMFHNLGLTIVDEEHRFGVNHRDRLAQKAKAGVHNISMSATPIPRTLALAVYGKRTQVYNIRTMPNGRKPVQTVVFRKEEEKVYEAMYRQIKDGHQCYVVCPLIDDSEGERMQDVDSVHKTYKKISDWFAQRHPQVKVEEIDGRLKTETAEKRLEEFAQGKSHILVSTTIIEVGVNVPNATVMFVKSAERFGLAQLHQLRGRVGRGNYQSYCVLSPTDPKKPCERLAVMARTADGFEIADKDLELRSMGEIVGIKQSGADVAVDVMLQYPGIYKNVVRVVNEIACDKEKYEHFKGVIEKGDVA